MNACAQQAFVGRFQPFHNGHLEVLQLLAAESGPLIIGITNPDSRELNHPATNPHRHLAHANPFSYFERAQMIAKLLDMLQLENTITIVPFPLEKKNVWSEYIPLSAVQVVRIFADWENEKAQRLSSGGYQIRKLEGDVIARVSGTDIRKAMCEESPWQQWVPEPIANYCDNLTSRLRR